jgi:hypothetical protein
MSEEELKAIIKEQRAREKQRLRAKDTNARLGQISERIIDSISVDDIIFKRTKYMMDFDSVAVMINVSNN